MAKSFLVPIDMNKLEILQPLLHKLASAPGSPAEAQFYYNTVDKSVEFHNGTSFITLGRLDQIEAPTASVSLNSQKITNLLDPSSAQDAATRGYVLGLTINALTALAADYSFNSHKLTNLTDGSGANDAVNKGQLDAVSSAWSAAVSAIASGISWKDSVRAAHTSGNLAVASAVINSATIGGVVVATGDRVLLTAQTAPAENGIYVVVASGAASRSTDSDTAADVQGTFVPVEEGTNASKIYYLATDTITLGSTSLTFSEFTGATYTGGAGLVLTGADFAVGAGTGIAVNANDVAVLRTDANGRVPLLWAGLIGNSTSVQLTHSLNSLDVIVQVYTVATGVEVECDVTRDGVNTVTLGFAVAPTANALRAVIHG